MHLPKYWIPQLKKVVANFDNTVPVSTLFDGLNCATQYNTFVSKIEKLKVSTKANTKFVSVNNVIIAFSSGIDLFKAINTKFVQKYYNDLVKPLITAYGIKLINIFEAGLAGRASALLNIFNNVKGYEQSCSGKLPVDQIKCSVFTSIQDFGKNLWCERFNMMRNA